MDHQEENPLLRDVGDFTSLAFKSRLVVFLLASGRPVDDGDGTQLAVQSRTAVLPRLVSLKSHPTSPSCE